MIYKWKKVFNFKKIIFEIGLVYSGFWLGILCDYKNISFWIGRFVFEIRMK